MRSSSVTLNLASLMQDCMVMQDLITLKLLCCAVSNRSIMWEFLGYYKLVREVASAFNDGFYSCGSQSGIFCAKFTRSCRTQSPRNLVMLCCGTTAALLPEL